MRRPGNQRGLMAPQPAADIAALDFAHASEALSRAFAAQEAVKGEVAAATVAEVIAECADRLISIPTREPGQIAEKVSAFAWLHNHAAKPFSDRDTRLRIADTGSDAAKGLLAIYLDLTAPPIAATMEERGTGENLSPALMARGTIKSDRAEWEAALAKYEAAARIRDRIENEERETDIDRGGEWDEAQSVCREALAALLAIRAPDGEAMGVKARLVLDQEHNHYLGDEPSNPAFISRLLAGDWNERLAASIYQDGLALAGIGGPVVEATAEVFDPEAWLDVIEAETGSRMVRSDGHSPRVHFEGGDADAAKVRLAALPPWQADDVETVAYNRIRRAAYDAAGPAPERIPSSPEELQTVFARGLLNTTPADQREALTAALAAFGINPTEAAR